jgi:branched-chain amino acid transport system substrate-binding protein
VAEQIAAAVRGGERVLGVIGHYNSGQTAAAMEIYKDLSIVVITPTASDMALTQQGYNNFFRVNAHNAAQARTAADFMVNQLGVGRAAVLYNDDDYGIDLGQRAVGEIEALGAEVVLTRQVGVEQNQFEAEVGAIRDSGADGLFYAGYEVECPYLRYDLRAGGLGDLPFLASDGCFLSYTINPPEDVIDRAMKGVSEGIYVLGFAPEPEAVAGANWIKGYQQVEYRNPDTYSVNGYAAMEVLAKGAEEAGNFNGPDVAQAIRGLNFESLIGQMDYQDNGDLKEQRFFIFQVQNGEFKQVAP